LRLGNVDGKVVPKSPTPLLIVLLIHDDTLDSELLLLEVLLELLADAVGGGRGHRQWACVRVCMCVCLCEHVYVYVCTEHVCMST